MSNEKRSLLVNLPKKSGGYDTHNTVTTVSSTLTVPIGAGQYSRMQKKRSAPRVEVPQTNEELDDEGMIYHPPPTKKKLHFLICHLYI